MKIKVRAQKRPGISSAAVLEEIKRSGVKGITAREMAKKFAGGEPVAMAKIMSSLPGCTMQWSPCVDWRVHYAAQEGRYWITHHKPKE